MACHRTQVLELSGGGVSMTPYLSIIIGVALSVCFCVAFTLWTRHRRRRRRCVCPRAQYVKEGGARR